MRIEDVYSDVLYDEYLERVLEAIRVGILMGKPNYKIAQEANLRMPGSTKYRTDLIKELRKIIEARQRRSR